MTYEHEYETTCGIVFDGDVYRRLKSILFAKCKNEPVEESVDVYVADTRECGSRYRALTRYTACCSVDDVPIDYVQHDHKKTVHVHEAQIPHVEDDDDDAGRRRVVFITCTYKESLERVLTAAEWKATVKEDHMSGNYVRIRNKRRICFLKGAFHTTGPYTRVSIGEQSSYGGTLEARSTCSSIYYLEIELETDRQPNAAEVKNNMHRLVETLFELVPYNLVKTTMLAENSGSVQRERMDSIFDTFKRRFLDYNKCAHELRRQQHAADAELNFFAMPKWDGTRAVGLYYCDGNLIVKDACGRMASFRTRLPFDNDMVLQLEVVRPKKDDAVNAPAAAAAAAAVGTDSEGYYYVITELMAVLIKSQNTLFQVYGRNNTVYDTGRNIGNVATSIAIKTQFVNGAHVCNLYRPLPADTSLRVLSALTTTTTTKKRNVKEDSNTAGGDVARPEDGAATSQSAYGGRHHRIITVTCVVSLTQQNGGGPLTNKDVLDRMDEALLRNVNAAPLSASGAAMTARRKAVLSAFTRLLPTYMRHDVRFKRDCEGLIVAYSTPHEHAYGYFKLKYTDTVDLELNLGNGTLTSADKTSYTAEGLPTLDTVQNWAERAAPIRNQRIIVECCYYYYDDDDDGGGGRGGGGHKLRFMRDRPDKSRPDSDSKIRATNELIFKYCRQERKKKNNNNNKPLNVFSTRPPLSDIC